MTGLTQISEDEKRGLICLIFTCAAKYIFGDIPALPYRFCSLVERWLKPFFRFENLHL